MASQFLSPLIIEEIDDTFFCVLQPFCYSSDLVGLITVQQGFKTDFASVPRIGAIYALFGDIAHKPAVIHDWLYYCGTVPRNTADSVLLEAMKVIEIPLWRRWPIYAGVKIGGWAAWNSHRKAGHSAKDFEGAIQ